VTVYYIDWTTGDDGNSGTSTLTPWKTLSKVSTQFAAGAFSPADEILFKRGESWTITSSSERLRIRGSSGSAGSHIVLGAYGSGALPIIDGNDGGIYRQYSGIYRDNGDAAANYITVQDILVQHIRQVGAIKVSDCNHWLFDGVTIQEIIREPTAPTPWCAGFRFDYSPTYLTVRNCTLYDIGGEGVYFGTGGDTSDVPEYCVVEKTSLQNCANNGIEFKVGCKNLTIALCTMDNCGWREYSVVALGGREHLFYGNNFDFDARRGIFTSYVAQLLGSDPTAHVLLRNIFKSAHADGAVYFGGDGNHALDNAFLNCGLGINLATDGLDAGAVHRLRGNHFDGNTRDVQQSTTKRSVDFSRYYDGDAVWYYSGSERNLAYVQGTLGQELHASTGGAFSESAFSAEDYSDADKLVHLQTWSDGESPLAIFAATGNIARALWHSDLDGLSEAEINAELVTFAADFSGLSAEVATTSPLRIEAVWQP